MEPESAAEQLQSTLAIIKPDAVERGLTGVIIKRIEDERFTIIGMRLVHLTKREAEGFYAVHRARPFFGALTDFMSSGPAVVLALQGEAAISRWRQLMGATNPAEADPDTLRRLYGSSIDRNATHGSDAPQTAAFEVGYFFEGSEFI
jgi:nucleoside-diphosphate kinase